MIRDKIKMKSISNKVHKSILTTLNLATQSLTKEKLKIRPKGR